MCYGTLLCPAADGEAIGLAFPELQSLQNRVAAMHWQARVYEKYKLLYDLHVAAAAAAARKQQQQMPEAMDVDQQQQQQRPAAEEGEQPEQQTEPAAAATTEEEQPAVIAAAAAEDLLADETLLEPAADSAAEEEDLDPAAIIAAVPAAAKGTLEEALKLLQLAASLPVDRSMLDILAHAAAAAVQWQEGVKALLPGPNGVPSRRGVTMHEFLGILQAGQALPFRLDGIDKLRTVLAAHNGWEDHARKALEQVQAASVAAAAAAVLQVPDRPLLADIVLLNDAAAADPLASLWQTPMSALVAAVAEWRENARV